jgi:hypothetical protein
MKGSIPEGRTGRVEILLGGILLLSTACGSLPTDPASLSSETLLASVLDGDRDGVQPLVLGTPELMKTLPRDPVEVRRWSLDGDVLTLEVRYGGGCREHRFALVSSPAWRLSMPPQVGLVLAHDADGDMCRALLSETLRYDLSSLRDAYFQDAGAEAGEGTILLDLQRHRIRYSFER